MSENPHTNTGPMAWESGALVALVLTLASLGLATLYSASIHLAMGQSLSPGAYVRPQIQGLIIGIAVAALVSMTHYRRLERFAVPMQLIMMIVLAAMILPGTEWLAPSERGVRRWLDLRVVRIQPSEFAKLTLIIWTASAVIRKDKDLVTWRWGTLPLLAIWGVTAALIALAPSVSAAFIAAVLGGIVALAGGARWRHFFGIGVLAALPLWLFVTSADYRLRRLTAFRDPLQYADAEGYQVVQSLTAIGSGGLLGRGFGQSQMRTGFLPEPHNDFASSILAEEWGFMGVVILVGLYMGIGLLSLRIAHRAPDRFGALLSVGCGALLVVPAFLHIAINLSMLPATGVTLPFVSFGRSNLLVNCIAVGILLSIATRSERKRTILREVNGS